ncbi:sigma-54-dependent Fis family transcriptional regulator [Rhizobium puerariae]|uniref:Sigma-54-dependent Fis family transcriptional regulator n=1 Tax=Rhizobium puerariae TaxID=1585791 RepID=A0ABV6AP64_9HYPH
MGAQIRQAWERFVSDGELPGQTIRDVVTQSWKRSAGFHVGFNRRLAPMVEEGELHRRRTGNAILISAAAPALGRSRTFLADARSMLILTEASGLIIATEGDPRVVDAGRANHLELGGHWHEQQIGTNAIGTALAEGAAVQIHGSEHYCEDVQRWTCAAVPVKNSANGRILGVVDISGRVESFNPQSMALAVAVGGEIESALDRMLRMEHEVLLRHFLMKRSVWLNEDMLVLDRYGLVVHATKEGGSAGVWKESGMREEVQTLPIPEWQAELRRREPNAKIEFVRQEGGEIGAIVLLGRPQAKTATRSGASSLRERVVLFSDILGKSPAMLAAKERAVRLSEAGLPVLIEGETGTGKELFARAIHAQVRGSQAPFVPVNCGGIARDLIASELFGYNKGSFTGADERGREGRIVAADGGTLCLDEIGEMPLELQSYLLRVLEDGIVYPVGSQEGRQVELSLVSMTNRSLAGEIAAGRFRSDLFYRVAAATITIPPLRDRGDDVILLAGHFAELAARRLSKAMPRFSEEALQAICAYRWPGNVRQLRNIIDAAVALMPGDDIRLENLPAEVREGIPVNVTSAAGALRKAEETAIREAVEACNGNMTEAARRLGIARSTLYVRLAEYGINR